MIRYGMRVRAGIGVWLTPVEAEMLLKVVDVDGSEHPRINVSNTV